MYKIHHYAMEVAEIAKVSNFYIEILGFEEDEILEFAGEEILFLRNGDFRLELIQQVQEKTLPECVHLCFETDSLQEIIKKFSKAGIVAEEGPFALKNGWKTVFFRGPANELIEFLQP